MDGTKNAWKRIVDDQYTVEDVWNYNSVNITIREYTESSVFSDYKLNYNGKFYSLQMNCNIIINTGLSMED